MFPLPPNSRFDPDLVSRALRRFRLASETNQPTHARLRLYLGEDRRNDLVETLLVAPWGDDQPIEEWIQATVGSRQFCMVFNNLESVSRPLRHGLGEVLEIVHQALGVPIGGSEQVAFVGNYSGTAFGVHNGDEPAFLLHLGPGSKTFRCWPEGTYKRLTGSHAPTFGDYSHLIPESESFELGPGDVLFLPRHEFHIGSQESYSVSIAIPLYTFPLERVISRAILPDIWARGEEEWAPSSSYSYEQGAEPHVTAAAQATRRLLRGFDPDQIDEAIKERWNIVASNGGWEPTDFDLARQDDTPSPEEVARALGDSASTATVRQGARLMWDYGNTGVSAHLRGRTIRCDTGQSTKDILTGLSHPDRGSIRFGQSASLDPNTREGKLLAELAATGGLRIEASRGLQYLP